MTDATAVHIIAADIIAVDFEAGVRKKTTPYIVFDVAISRPVYGKDHSVHCLLCGSGIHLKLVGGSGASQMVRMPYSCSHMTAAVTAAFAQ